ncbi:MAG: FAD-dependent oxidoreductase [Parvularculaceae bacterium]
MSFRFIRLLPNAEAFAQYGEGSRKANNDQRSGETGGASKVRRREVLGGAAAAACVAGKGAMAIEQSYGLEAFDAPLAPVKVEASREIETLVGLRPYRDEGFVVSAEKLGAKTIVHNYGHGGSGVTLSWGSARLALAAAAPFSFSRAAIIGAGVIGLTTALSLAHNGVAVTIYAAEASPHTTSNVAAALWQPTTVFRPDRVGGAFLDQFRFAARVSHEVFRREAGDPARGVRWIRMFDLSDAPGRPQRAEGDDLYPGAAFDAQSARRFNVPYAERYYAMVIDMSVYLPTLMREFDMAGGRIVGRRFSSLEDLVALDEGVIFNCAGYGARALFGDESLRPVRGQITLLKGQPKVDYGYVRDGPSGLLYMFPRAGAIALGGSMGWGETSLAVNESDKRRMLDGHAAIAARLAEAGTTASSDKSASGSIL